MPAPRFDDKVVFQVAFVTSDIDRTSDWCCRFFDLPPPRIVQTAERSAAQTEYLGEPSDARARLAFFEFGNVTLELIEPNDKPSCWREFLDRNGPGFHHFAFKIRGMKEKVAAFGRDGFPLLQRGEFEGGRYAYIDTEPQLGALIELLEFDRELNQTANAAETEPAGNP